MKQLLFVSSFLFVALTVHAQSLSEGGAGTKGGGEAAERDFKNRRDDFREGFLKHPHGVPSMKLSAEDQTFKLEDYKNDLIRWTSSGKPTTTQLTVPPAVRVEFVSLEQNRRLPVAQRVQVSGVQKTCVSFLRRPLIRCITEKYWATPAKERTALVIHEYHVLSGYEATQTTVPGESDFHLTNVVTKFLAPYASEMDYKFSLKPPGEWVRPVQGNSSALSALPKGTILRFLESLVVPARTAKIPLNDIEIEVKGNYPDYFCFFEISEAQVAPHDRVIRSGDLYEVIDGKQTLQTIVYRGSLSPNYKLDERLYLGKVGSNQASFSIACYNLGITESNLDRLYRTDKLTSAYFFFDHLNPHPDTAEMFNYRYIPGEGPQRSAGIGRKIEIYSIPDANDF